jgi:hypothetical protein
MSDNPVPQIHCDHECVCWWYYEHKKSGTASPCESEKCHHRFQFNDERTAQCKNCIRKRHRDCMYHGYPKDTIPKSCAYKIGDAAVYTVYDVPTLIHDSPRYGGESPARQGCEGAVSEDSRKED